MSSDLKVMNLTCKSPACHPLKFKHLPNPSECFRLIFFSPSNSGKSNVIKNMITRSEFGYNNYYKNNIFLFSRTVDIDPV